MPVRSLNSSVLRWPARDDVLAAARTWAAAEGGARANLLRIGCFGSATGGSWGVGSDLDLVAVVATVKRSFAERGRDWDLTRLPVPAEILVYTATEWEQVVNRGDRFAGVMSRDVVWLWERG
ncbi:nucleotidyltransferase domain-containing protein [bacterium]|nr:nucleotidyltransferase domain-containing protein [bacterium]